MRLEGRSAIVTGGAQGIGKAIAAAFAAEGANVLIGDINGDRAAETAKELASSGETVRAVRVDVAEATGGQALVDACVEAFGRVDILVNNAGVGSNVRTVDLTLEEWERVVRINLTGAFLCAQAAARHMLRRKSGKIINIVSLSGQRGGIGRAAYGSAKAGLELLTKVMAVELAEEGINVNGIVPGPIATDVGRAMHDPATVAAYKFLVPQRRYGEPDEIAKAAVFLASSDSDYVNGHSLNVDGGFQAAGLMYPLPSPGQG
ncbi:MAG: short-chain dehydrogenase [Rhodospirillaceae bacterium]|nr:short-chain dehydrogenase [Rhodospirillaceae bacterium]|tara:strand:- start:360 stop:1142 length:783 start_codon:yes stop_codon:yes gene_type:complete